MLTGFIDKITQFTNSFSQFKKYKHFEFNNLLHLNQKS